ncbi:MAG: hypothetical protein K8S16_15490 [Bacteroidales bacterium]|nr:hypothetical protein [Bacteroidales bacterium]
MKAQNVIIFSLIAIVIVAAISGGIFFKDYQKDQSVLLKIEEDRGNSLALKLHQRDSIVNDYVNTLNQIEKDLLYIKEQENLLDVQTKDQELAKDKKVKIQEDIQLVYGLVEQNKKKIAELSKKLKKSGVEIASLNEKVKYLSNAIEEQDLNILALNGQLVEKDTEITNLNGQVGTLETVVMTQKSLIEEQEITMNTAYILSGNFKDLKEKGIVTKTGGFLGLGKSKSLESTVSKEFFTEIDLTETKSYPIYAEKAELITEHPEGSYEWVEENEQVAYMLINDPREFWKISKYAVLEIK